MNKPLPMKIRERAVRFVQAGESRHKVTARFGVVPSTVIYWLSRFEKTGSVAPAKVGGCRPKKIIGAYREWMLKRMAAGDFTLQVLADELEQQRPAVACRRAAWKRVQPRMDATDFVCIDETWTKTNKAPLHGWSPVGERCRDQVPHGHWVTQTCIAGVTASGVITPFVFDGPINGESFLAYVEQFLVPELTPRHAVILDNLGSHKREAVKQALRNTGVRLFYLPAYSPDLNPIGQAFAKLKHMFRKAKQRSIVRLQEHADCLQ